MKLVISNRSSSDKGHTNNNGTLLLELCKQSGFRISNGRVGDDKGVGKNTFVNSQGTSDTFYLHCSFCRGQMGRG